MSSSPNASALDAQKTPGYSYLKSAGRFLYQKILTQPCCWMSLSPPLRHFFFPTHNPTLELGVSAALVVGAVEGERAFRKWRGKPPCHSRRFDYAVTASFMLAAYSVSHALIPHDEAAHHHPHHHENHETHAVCDEPACKNITFG